MSTENEIAIAQHAQNNIVIAGDHNTVQQFIQYVKKELTRYPYKFLSAYDLADQDIFFGRNAVIEELVATIPRHKVLLINGASGAGKSSLLNAGVIPRLTEQGYRFLTIRDYTDPLQQLRTEFIRQQWLAAPAVETGSLTQMLRTLHQQSITLLLVFDQFEQFFLQVPYATRQAFLQEFKVCLGSLSVDEMNVVFAIRRDFLGQMLAEFEQVISTSFSQESKRLDLYPLSKAEAREAIMNPLKHLAVKIGYDKSFVEDILLTRLLEQTSDQVGIEPPHLQIVCNQLYETAHRRLSAEIDMVQINAALYDELGGVEKILQTYLDEVVKEITADKPAKIAVVRSLLKAMIETSGTRRFISVADLQRALPDVDGAEIERFLGQLQDRRVLETRQREEEWQFSLSHEIMVAQVASWYDEREWELKRAEETLERGLKEWASSKTLLNEKQFSHIRQWLPQVDENAQALLVKSEAAVAEQKRKEKRQSRLKQALVSLVFVAAIVAMWFAYRASENEKVATEQKVVAQQERDEANKQRVNAELQASALTAEKLLDSGNKLDALIEAIKAGKQLQQAKRENIKIKPEISNPVRVALHRAVYETREYNRIERVGTDSISDNISFSPDGQLFASTHNGSLIIWRRDGTVFKKMGTSVEDYAVAFSPDSKAVAVAAEDRQQRSANLVQLWSIDGNLLQSFEGTTGIVYRIRFSPDGQTLIASYSSGPQDCGIKIWHRDGNLLGTFVPTQSTADDPTCRVSDRDIGFSSDGTSILTIEGTTLKFWNLEGQLLKSVKKEGSIENSATSIFSADVKTVISGISDNIVIWNTEGKELATLKIGQDSSTVVAFSPDGKAVATYDYQSEEITLRKIDGIFISTVGKCNWHSCQLEFSPDGQILISTSITDSTIRLWKIGNPLVYPPMIHTTGRITFSPDEQTLALIDKDKIIRLYSRDGRLLKMIEAYKEGVSDVKFSPDGKTLISVGGYQAIGEKWDGEVQYQFTKPQQDYDNSVAKIWDLDGKLAGMVDLWANFILRQGHNSEDESLAVMFHPDGKAVFSGGRSVFTWNLEGPYGTLLTNLGPCNGNQLIWDIKFNFNGEMIAVTCDEQIVIFEGNKPAYRLGNHSDIVWRINFSPDGKKLISASRDNTVKLWDIAEKKELLTLKFDSVIDPAEGAIGQKDASFSPDGQTILTAGETGIHLWDLTGKQLAKFAGETEVTDEFVGIGIHLELDEKTKIPTITQVYDNLPAFKAGIKKGDQILEINGIATTGLILDDVLGLLTGEVGSRVNLVLSSDKGRFSHSLLRETIRSVRKVPVPVYLTARFSPDGQTIAAGSTNEVLELWSREGQLLKNFKVNHVVRDLSFSPNGKLLASTSYGDHAVTLWNVAEGKAFKTLKHNAGVYAVSFSPDGQLLATASADYIVRIWKADGTLLKPLLGQARPIYNYLGADRIDITPDGKTLILASTTHINRMVQTRDMQGRLLNVLGASQWEWFSPEGHLQVSPNSGNPPFEKVIVSPDGKVWASKFLSGDENVVYLYATDGSWNEKKLEGHTSGVGDISFSLDSKLLASVSTDGTLKIWNIDGMDSNLRQSIQIPSGVLMLTSFGIDGLLVSKEIKNVKRSVRLWNSNGSSLGILDTSSTSELFKLAEISNDESYFNNDEISFSPNGETLVTEVYRVFSPEELGTKNNGVVYKMAFWSFDLDYLLKRGCDLISPFLQSENSLAQKERYLCTGIDYAGTLLLDEGDYLANSGEVEAATAKFTEALQKNPKLNFDPRQRAQQLAVSFLVAEGEKLANQNDVPGAIVKFQKALEWNPSLGIHAEEKARQLDEKAQQNKEQKLFEKANLLNMGDKATTQEILNAYTEVLKSPRLQTEVLKRLEQMAEGLLVDYKNKPNEAIPILEKIIEIKSDHENAWSLMGNALFRQNKIDDATVAYEKQLAINPNHEMALKGLMSVFAEQQKLATEGLAFINKLVADNPQHPSAWYILGKILDGQRKYEEALVAFKKQVEVNPEHKGAWLARGQVSLQLNNFDEVATAFENLLLKFKDQCECDENYVWYFFGFASEQQAKLLEQQGKLSEKKGKLDDARLAYNQVNFRNADYYLLAQERVVKLMSDIGPLWRERAIERLRQQLSYNLARISFGLDHQIPMGLTQLEIQLLLDSDRREEAMTVYNKMTRQVDSAIQQAENEFQSQSCVQSGNSPQNEECISDLKDWKDKKITDMLFKRVLLAGKVDDLKRIEQDSRHILEINSKHVDALYALGYTLANNTDRYQESLDLLERALELQPNHPIILSGIGWVLYKMGKSPESIEYLRKAYAKMDDSISPETVAETASHLGEVLWASGEQEEAKTVWKKALKDFPDNQPLREVVKKFWAEFKRE